MHAYAECSRNDLGNSVLLFTCPESWLPQDQESFNDAARYYGVRRPEEIKFEPGLVPF